jgi:putative acyl-CoA dehydrogenase
MLRRSNFFLFISPVAPSKSSFDFTHQVVNQATPLVNFDLLKSNPRFLETLDHAVASGLIPQSDKDLCAKFGKAAGSQEMLEAAQLANKNPPTFAAFDRYGRRGPGRADFHPSYHTLMNLAVEHRVPSLPWIQKDAFVQRNVLSAMHYQLEQGTSCPLTMTFAGVAPLKRALSKSSSSSETQELKFWIDKLTSGKYDSRDLHISLKDGATIGMSMTEKQGGSDVRSNTTVATPMDNSDTTSSFFTLRGHKWFTSAPMCDAFLTLAQVEGKGLSCFLVPRWIAPDTPNLGLQFQRIKDKLGDKSNASSEVEYHDAVGFLVGEPGQGVKTIIEMVNLTRLDCLSGSAALMHRAALEACHHAQSRSAFGGVLHKKPLMQNVLCDLAVEAEAANALALRVSHAFNPSSPKGEAVFARIGVAIAKYFVCKRAPAFAYEAMECLGGNGYTEDFIMACLFRQSPLNAIWEGSGNVIVLDVFRAITREPATLDALRAELSVCGSDARLAAALQKVDAAVKNFGPSSEVEGRQIVERIARLLQAAALKKSVNISPSAQLVYDAFVETRLMESTGGGFCLFGTLPSKFVGEELQKRITPVF